MEDRGVSSGGLVHIVTKQPSNPSSPADIPERRADWFLTALPRRRNRPIPQPLVRPFRVVMLDVLADEVIEMLLAEREKVIQTLDLQ